MCSKNGILRDNNVDNLSHMEYRNCSLILLEQLDLENIYIEDGHFLHKKVRKSIRN